MKRLGHIFLIIALLAATGSHWALLQSVAWTNMLADNLHNYSFTEAVQRTFDGNHPCNLCCQIKEGKQTEKKSEFPVEVKKIEFLPMSAALILTAPRMSELPAFTALAVPSLIHQPAVPPPRSLFA